MFAHDPHYSSLSNCISRMRLSRRIAFGLVIRGTRAVLVLLVYKFLVRRIAYASRLIIRKRAKKKHVHLFPFDLHTPLTPRRLFRFKYLEDRVLFTNLAARSARIRESITWPPPSWLYRTLVAMALYGVCK